MYPSYHQVFINFIFLLVLVLLFTILLIYRGKNKEDYRKILDERRKLRKKLRELSKPAEYEDIMNELKKVKEEIKEKVNFLKRDYRDFVIEIEVRRGIKIKRDGDLLYITTIKNGRVYSIELYPGRFEIGEIINILKDKRVKYLISMRKKDDMQKLWT